MSKNSKMPNFYIKPDHVDQLRGKGDWRLQDVPAAEAGKIRPFMSGADVIAVMASGSGIPTTDGVVGGFEIIRLESNPKPNEPPLNIYHYEIGVQTTVAGEQVHPVWGPQKTGGPGVDHWDDYTALNVYFARLEEEEG